VVLAEDETHLNLLAWVRATWIPTGHRQQVMTPGTNRRRIIFGAVDLASGQWVTGSPKGISATFTGFCKQLLAAYPAAPVVAVICDNVIIHRSKLLQRWLAAHPRLRVLHGARYSPHDNPTERIWGALKAWLANNAGCRPWPSRPHRTSGLSWAPAIKAAARGRRDFAGERGESGRPFSVAPETDT
jgi:transposase